MSQDPTAICPGCCQRVDACMCPKPPRTTAGDIVRFDRVNRGPDGKFCHWFRGQPVNDPNAKPEERPHDWPYCAAMADAMTTGTGVVQHQADGTIRHVPLSEVYAPSMSVVHHPAQEMTVNSVRHLAVYENGNAECVIKSGNAPGRMTLYAHQTLTVTRQAEGLRLEFRPVPSPVAASDVLVALADLEAAALKGPTNPQHVRALASKIRAALMEE